MIDFYNQLGKCFEVEDENGNLKRVKLTKEIFLNLISNDKRSIQAHRGSYKSTAIDTVGIILRLLFVPDDRICIIRKTYTLAAEILQTVKTAFLIPEIKELFKLAHNDIYPKALTSRDNMLTFNFKKTVTPEGSVNAYGVHQDMTGKHFDFILADDFVTIDDKISKTEREKTIIRIQEIQSNILDPGKQMGFVGTPWHKLDAWTICPNTLKFDVNMLDILTEEQKKEKKETQSPISWSANYELRHKASDDCWFKDPSFDRWLFYVDTGIFHLDKKYFGTDTNALTFCAKKPNGRYQVLGKVWSDHIKFHYDDIYRLWQKYKIGDGYTENNDDKDESTADRLMERGIRKVNSYHESLNKHVKINDYLLENGFWNLIDFDPETDKAYMEQILDYTEGSEPDDACFIAGTKIMTSKGYKNIEDIKINDNVLTPFGFSKVLESKCTGEKKVIKNIGLTGTPNHKIYNKKQNKFVSLDTLTCMTNCVILSLKGLIKWALKKQLYLMGQRIPKRESIIFVNQKMEKNTDHNCIKQFGNFIIKGKYQKAFIFITKILIQIITIPIIWNYLQVRSIFPCMQKEIIKKIKNKLITILIKSDTKQRNGIKAKKEKNGIKNMFLNLLKNHGNGEKKGFVSNAQKNILRKLKGKNFAVINVNGESGKDKIEENQKVYNLTVENGVYYANNILVSNCDSLACIGRIMIGRKANSSYTKMFAKTN